MKLNPYLNFPGNAEEAINFYKNALGGEISQLGRFGESPMPCDEADKQKIMHARLTFDGNLIMFSDGMKGMQFASNGHIQLAVDVSDRPDELETIFNKMAEDGKVTMPLADQFWGSKFGMLQDKFGINWMFNCELKK
jgi:PhnB protein